MNLQKFLDKILTSPHTIDLWNDFMDSLILEKLKEDYLNAVKWNVEAETIYGFKQLLRYYMISSDYHEFMLEAKDVCTHSK
jgi:hypothetical protein